MTLEQYYDKTNKMLENKNNFRESDICKMLVLYPIVYNEVLQEDKCFIKQINVIEAGGKYYAIQSEEGKAECYQMLDDKIDTMKIDQPYECQLEKIDGKIILKRPY